MHVINEVQITENQDGTYQITGVIQTNNDVIEAYKNRAVRFIIATNRLDSESFTCDEMLIKYKEQQHVERGFAFLKDPLFFALLCVIEISSKNRNARQCLWVYV